MGRPEFDDLLRRATSLPELNASLQVRLPTLFTWSIERAQAALEDDDDEAFDDELLEIAETLDTNEQRIELARAVIALRDAGKVPPKVAAAAVFNSAVEPDRTFYSRRLPSQSRYGPAMLALPLG